MRASALAARTAVPIACGESSGIFLAELYTACSWRRLRFTLALRRAEGGLSRRAEGGFLSEAMLFACCALTGGRAVLVFGCAMLEPCLRAFVFLCCASGLGARLPGLFRVGCAAGCLVLGFVDYITAAANCPRGVSRELEAVVLSTETSLFTQRASMAVYFSQTPVRAKSLCRGSPQQL